MQVTDPNVIKAGERDLIEAVKDDLDWDAVREIVKNRIELAKLESRGGEIVVHENRIAFRVDLSLNLDVSLMFDRDGNYIQAVDTDEGVRTTVQDFTEGTEAEDDDGLDALTDLESLEPDTEQSEPESSEALQLDLELDEDPSGFDLADDAEDDVEDESESVLDTLEDGPLELDLEGDADEEDDGVIDLEDSVEGEPELDMEELTLLDDDTGEESLDDDIDEILKESREFWEQKKGD